jgi:hypothetical protein
VIRLILFIVLFSIASRAEAITLNSNSVFVQVPPAAADFEACTPLFQHQTPDVPPQISTVPVGGLWKMTFVSEDTPAVDYTGFTFILFFAPSTETWAAIGNDEEAIAVADGVIPATVTGGPGSVTISVSPAETVLMSGWSGAFVLWIIDPLGVNPFTWMSIPIAVYPAITRLP